MSIESSYNFKAVSNRITTSGVVPKEVLEEISNEGYEVVINLLPDYQEQSVTGEKEILELQNITYVSIPVDFDRPQEEELSQFMQELEVMGDKKIHIHCAANWRVSAFYGVYAVLNGIWNKEQAKKFIKDIWNPEEYPAWLGLLNQYGLSEDDA